MGHKKIGSAKNYGYGRSLKYAAKLALEDRYGIGRFGTRRTMAMRMNRFISFMRGSQVREFEGVTEKLVHRYVANLSQKVESGLLKVSTAHNYLSAVNQVMMTMRNDRALWLSPSDAFGKRSFVRKSVPETLDDTLVRAVESCLDASGETRLASMMRLCRVLGLRFREASLLEVRQALREAKRLGRVTVTRGTKGGRKRTVIADDDAVNVLSAIVGADNGSRNVIPAEWTFKEWSNYCYRTWRRYAGRLGVSYTNKELRTAFACRLYKDVAGVDAPVVTGGRTVEGKADHRARLHVASALGHSREQIAGCYIGTSVRAQK